MSTKRRTKSEKEMSRARERGRRRARQEPPAAPASQPSGGAFYFGGDLPPIYLDGWTDDDRAGISGDGRPVDISGNFVHVPARGGRTAYVRYMTIGKREQPPRASKA
jgi:hypothetical protein